MADRKPVGGVRRVSLYEATKVVAFSREGSVCRLTLRAGAEPLLPTVIEEQSSLHETVSCDEGALLVKQQLSLKLLRSEGEQLFPPQKLGRAITEGWVAVVESVDGSSTVVGCSTRLQAESPLYTRRLEFDSGAARKEYPLCLWLLEGESTELGIGGTTTEVSYA